MIFDFDCRKHVMLQSIKIDVELFSADDVYSRDEIVMGRADSAQNKIYVRADMPTQAREETLIHEVVEHINNRYDLRLNHTTICTLANGVYAFIIDNIEETK